MAGAPSHHRAGGRGAEAGGRRRQAVGGARQLVVQFDTLQPGRRDLVHHAVVAQGRGAHRPAGPGPRRRAGRSRAHLRTVLPRRGAARRRRARHRHRAVDRARICPGARRPRRPVDLPGPVPISESSFPMSTIDVPSTTDPSARGAGRVVRCREPGRLRDAQARATAAAASAATAGRQVRSAARGAGPGRAPPARHRGSLQRAQHRRPHRRGRPRGRPDVHRVSRWTRRSR